MATRVQQNPANGVDYGIGRPVQAIIVGSPERVRGHVEELCAAGLVEYVVGGFAFGDLSHDEALRSIDLFSEHVVGPLG